MTKTKQPRDKKTSAKQDPARDEQGRLLPGHTANPNGRPLKGYSITETIKDMMAAKPEIKQALGTKLIELALRGDLAAIKLLMGYIDGNPVNTTELTGKGGGPVELTAVPYEQLLAEAKALGISITHYERLDPGTSDSGTGPQDRDQKGT
jgi:hypothetical protein